MFCCCQEVMDMWGNWDFSTEMGDRLDKICLSLGDKYSSTVSKDWLWLLNFDSSSPAIIETEVDSGPSSRVDRILNIIKESLASNSFIPEDIFVGISVNSLSRVLMSINALLDDFGFCGFCKNIVSWKQDILVTSALTLVVLPKLKDFSETTGCIIFSIKELAAAKPNKLCENVFIPLLSDDAFQFTDVELLKGVFLVFPPALQDLLVLTLAKKKEFVESDWLLLHPLVKDLSQNSLLNVFECIQKHSKEFCKSQVFGRFLVNFCKTIAFIHDKNSLREVIETHETLLKIQALKYCDQM